MASLLLGWTYTICWSLSFYPQLLLNYKQKSVHGLSLDFVVLNTIGFTCYSIYCLSFYYSAVIQQQYRDRWNTNVFSVQWNDVVFSTHALIVTLMVLLQCVVYPSVHPNNHHIEHSTNTNHHAITTSSSSSLLEFTPSKTIHNFTKLFLISWASILLLALALVLLVTPPNSHLQSIDILYLLSLFKMMITLLKYIPQLLLNYQRKSTVGWSIENILLDLVGGTCSILQMVYDAWVSRDTSLVWGNPVKFGLGFASVLFDLLFMVQHYCMYSSSILELLREEEEELLQ